MYDTFAELRGKIDGNDQFMRGHQIIKIRHISRDIPEWTKTDEGIQQVILRSFPKMNSDSRQRNRAGRWALIIHLYFRMQESRTFIAEEMGLKPNTVNTLINNIKRAGAGRRADGRGMLGARPIGRPRKIVLVPDLKRAA
jgi:hypothetical protein